jgi:hypothetical protein
VDDGEAEDALQHPERLADHRVAGAGAAHRLDELQVDDARRDRAQPHVAQARQDVLDPHALVGRAGVRAEVRDRVDPPVLLDERGERRDLLVEDDHAAELEHRAGLRGEADRVALAGERPAAPAARRLEPSHLVLAVRLLPHRDVH